MAMKSELAYISLKHKIIIASFAGPLLLIIAKMNGADFWDGFAGSGRTNTSLQDNLITFGLWVPILMSFVTVALCVYYARKFNHTEKRFITRLVPLSILLPFPFAIICLAVMMFF